MQNEIIISDAKPEDAEGITTVLYKTWLATYPNEKFGITLDDVEERYKDTFSEKAIQAQQERIAENPPYIKKLVAKEGDRIIGTASFVRGDEKNQLRTMYVLPEFQGQGIGKRLWEEGKSFFDPNKDIFVEVAEYVTGSIEFYKKLGFKETGRKFTDERYRMKSGSIMPLIEMVTKANNS